MSSKLLFKKDGLEVFTHDVVELTNGKIASIFGSEFQYDMVDENTKILLTTNPISSLTSYCYPKHIKRVIEHCGCFENEMDWWFKSGVKQELYIHLEKEDN